MTFSTKGLKAECRYLIYWYAACRYAECRGAVQKKAMGDKRNAKKIIKFRQDFLLKRVC